MTNRVVMCLSGAVRPLIHACHPVPTAAVTTLTVALGAVLGVPAVTLVILGVAFLTGQLSIGWLNDYVDRDRDRAAHRTDKPVAEGAISAGAVRWAAVSAAAVCVPASLALGLVPGVVHLLAVGAAWVYNLGAKKTVWSWLPYAVGFGLLPVIVWLVSPQAGLPPWWLIAGAALLGVGAHGANVLPDLEADRSTGVAGLPHRMPLRVLRATTAGVLLGALLLLTLGSSAELTIVDIAVLGAGTVLAAIAAGIGGSRLPARAPLLAAAGIAGLAIAALLTGSAT